MAYLPERNEDYGTRDYWDTRYTEEETFDWFKTYAEIGDLLRQLIPVKTSRIAMLGCGNSTLSADMYKDGYKNIVNVDYSPILIEKMASKYSDLHEMTWIIGDITSLPPEMEDGTFDFAIDKGTMDALLAFKGDVWNPPESAIKACNAEVDEVVRILKRPFGKFIYLTFGQPHFRKQYLQREGWKVEVIEVGEAFYYYLYVMQKDDST